MTIERQVRLIAGSMVLLSLTLGWFMNPLWFLMTAFVGANLFQSSLTDWCLLEDLLNARQKRRAD